MFLPATRRYENALYYADKALEYEPEYQAAHLLKAQIYLSAYDFERAVKELTIILDNKEHWYDYTPFYAEQMMQDIIQTMDES